MHLQCRPTIAGRSQVSRSITTRGSELSRVKTDVNPTFAVHLLSDSAFAITSHHPSVVCAIITTTAQQSSTDRASTATNLNQSPIGRAITTTAHQLPKDRAFTATNLYQSSMGRAITTTIAQQSPKDPPSTATNVDQSSMGRAITRTVEIQSPNDPASTATNPHESSMGRAITTTVAQFCGGFVLGVIICLVLVGQVSVYDVLWNVVTRTVARDLDYGHGGVGGSVQDWAAADRYRKYVGRY